MNYSAAPYGIVEPPVRSNTIKIIVAVVICIVILLIIAAIAIALGVGLGVGLSRRNQDSSGGSSSSSSSSSSGSSSSNNYPVIAAPTVSCTYTSASTCGCASTKPTFLQPRIIQGYTSVSNSWPWIVALYINNNRVFCGGFLVAFQYVVTAAHCVNGVGASTIQVYAGLQKLSSRFSAPVRSVSTVTVHPSYSATGFINDIAVLKLASSFDNTTTTIGLCCLSSDTSLPSLNEHGVIAGWGVTVSNQSAAQSDDLLQGVIQVQGDTQTCQTSANSNVQFCAAYNATDSCYGDSGSPFMSNVNNAWTCTGLVSNGINGCGHNSAYTRVTAFQTFINTAMNS